LRPLTSGELLEAWEKGLDQTMLEKTLHLLGKACSVNNLDEIARLSIGNRDAKLMQLREWMFGQRLRSMATCSQCGEAIEWECDLNELHLQQPLLPDLLVKTFTLEKNGFNILFRLPDSFDVLKAMNNHEDSRKILTDCIVEVYHQDKKSTVDAFTEEIWDALNERMADEDPQADIRMNISCPVCLSQWEATFDIMSYLWTEINNWALRVMQEVCLLARSFGWSEQDILNMSARRRHFYLQMLRT
jgi:hypothetical protein